jgi:hypothetical protein
MQKTQRSSAMGGRLPKPLIVLLATRGTLLLSRPSTAHSSLRPRVSGSRPRGTLVADHDCEDAHVDALREIRASTALETDHVPPRRGHRPLRTVVPSAQRLTVRHHRRPTTRPREDVIDLVRRRGTPAPCDERRTLAASAGAGENRLPRRVLEPAPDITSTRVGTAPRHRECEHREDHRTRNEPPQVRTKNRGHFREHRRDHRCSERTWSIRRKYDAAMSDATLSSGAQCRIRSPPHADVSNACSRATTGEGR